MRLTMRTFDSYQAHHYPAAVLPGQRHGTVTPASDRRERSCSAIPQRPIASWVAFDWDEQGWQSFVSDPEVPPILKEAGTQGKAPGRPAGPQHRRLSISHRRAARLPSDRPVAVAGGGPWRRLRC
jgi:hypothetical protein